MEKEETERIGSAAGGDEDAPASAIDRQQVDAAVLHYQNQRLVQQLEAQKAEMHTLEGKFKELREKQSSYNKSLMALHKMWNQLVEDLILLCIRAGGDLHSMQMLDYEDHSKDALESCSPEEVFLFRLTRLNPTEKKVENLFANVVQEALASRRSATINLMKYVLDMITSRRAKNECLVFALQGNLSSEDAVSQLQKFDESLREVVNNMHQAADVLSQKHKQITEEINICKINFSTTESEIKHISGELEESMAELEETRRKLAIMQMHMHGASTAHALIANGSSSPDKCVDRTMGLKDLKESIEEAKTLAASRLLELQEAQEDFLIVSKQLEDLQSQLKDENYVISSKQYSLINDQLQHLNAELARYKSLIESFQADRTNYLLRENELNVKADSADSIKVSIRNHEAKIAEFEIQIQNFTAEKNNLESKLEEAEQDLGRKDIKDEIHVMASALTKEMEMMESQLNRSKEAASEALALREEAESLRSLLNRKVLEHKTLSDEYAKEMVERKPLKELVENLEKEKQELQIILDMHGKEYHDTRTISEIKESEQRARVQADLLKATLAENSLELRVKAANDAEATYNQRHSVAEAEIPELRARLDAAKRDVLELQETIRIKEAEGEAYISEIETIGQAYEDMQTQNQHLLQLVADRDAYNIKLVSDSVKMKQTHSSLLSEKQTISKQLQQVNSSLEFLKTKVTNGEEQMKAHVTQAVKASTESRHININMEKNKLELIDAEKELKWLRTTVSSVEKEYERNQKKITDLRIELEKERKERKKLEEELTEVKAEVLEMSSESEEVTIQKLQDEIKECKAILKCGVCFDRPKEVVITKCFHLFCYPCIQRNLEIRHRKCPGCGTAFGQNDVREVKI
ncbi:E3 ubiquitin-protein ligase BRE1-like 2 [Zingiber officinale]|uniref:E3 ubiquitin-protein ligase BRE1-like 2 n=1 Tax=Zingiber officinale TaxID=94328 RepID=UPI001C4B9F3C|nr:E3 ubiquitin-protein ligase BRE1-like 2 [Zingiber officinale]